MGDSKTTYRFEPAKTSFMPFRSYGVLQALAVFQLFVEDDDTDPNDSSRIRSTYYVKPLRDSVRARALTSLTGGAFVNNPGLDEILILGKDEFFSPTERVCFRGTLVPRKQPTTQTPRNRPVRITAVHLGTKCHFWELPVDPNIVFCRQFGELTWMLYIKLDEYTAKRVCAINDMHEINSKLAAAVQTNDGTLESFHPDDYVEVVYIEKHPLRNQR